MEQEIDANILFKPINCYLKYDIHFIIQNRTLKLETKKPDRKCFTIIG